MLRRDQRRRLGEAIDRNPLISEELKAEFDSILQDPEEAEEFLDNKELDPYFPTRQATVQVGTRTWKLRIGPHTQIKLILEDLTEDVLKSLFQSGIARAEKTGQPALEDLSKYIIEGYTLKGATATLVVELDEVTRRVSHTVTLYRGRHRKYEPGIVIHLPKPRRLFVLKDQDRQ
jgi:hypothetical protein